MPLPEHMQQALSRLERADLKVKSASRKPDSPERIEEWLEGLTEYVLALSDLHELDREDLANELGVIKARLGLDASPPTRPHRSGSRRT